MAWRDRLDPPAALGRVGGDEEALYADRARRLGLRFASVVLLGRGATAANAAAVRRARFALSTTGERLFFLAPEEDALPQIRNWVAAHREQATRLRVATPTAIRAALMASGGRRFVAAAIARLAGAHPEFSARRVFTASQIVLGLLLAAGAAVAIRETPAASFLALDIAASVFFFGVTILRFIAARLTSVRHPTRLADTRGESLPVYTVLVPLYREERLVKQLVAALGRLQWPTSRLDIKLIVEEDDLPTRRAVERAVSGAPFEVIVVPAAAPRTKPKALAYALPFARGHYVTIYDAEDRPHPGQLREAYAVFRRSDPTLACLQAPIVIDDPGKSRIARLFAAEYSALFDGLLPALVALRLPLPLGGTSNHFRREALENVCGWDPYNVTEDADLGIRLARFGYRTGILTLPTGEEAPVEPLPWLRQRTRWFKGWMQTWLVHMRNPLRLIGELGLRQFVGFNLIGFGMLVSAFIHPITLAFFALVLIDPLSLWRDGGLLAAAAVGINLFNLFAGYTAMAVLSRRTLALRGRQSEAPILLWLPLYWLLMSVACYRAALQLLMQPHLWEKTPHRGRPSATMPLALAKAQRDRPSRRAPQQSAIGAASFGRRAR